MALEFNPLQAALLSKRQQYSKDSFIFIKAFI